VVFSGYPISSNNKTEKCINNDTLPLMRLKPAFLIGYKFREILGCIRDSKECLSD